MLKGYLIGRVHPSCHEHNDEIANLGEGPKLIQQIFRPHNYTPEGPHDMFEYDVAKMDVDQMERSDIGIVALPIGVDCGSEVGWFAGRGKPIVAIIHDWSDQKKINKHAPSRKAQWESLRRHWMVKYFLTAIIIVGDNFEDDNDPILCDKIIYIPEDHNVYDQLDELVDDWKVTKPWYPRHPNV